MIDCETYCDNNIILLNVILSVDIIDTIGYDVSEILNGGSNNEF